MPPCALDCAGERVDALQGARWDVNGGGAVTARR